MRRRIATRSLVTETGAFDRAAIMADAWTIYRRWYRHDAAHFGERFGLVLRQLWDNARLQQAEKLREIASAAAFAAARARRVAAEQSDAGRALAEEREMLVFCDDWRHVARRRSEIDAQLSRLAA